MLTGRITRITEAVHLADVDAAMDAVLSLKIASNMVGAEAMEHCCLLLQAQLKAGDSDAAGTTTTALEDERGPLLAALADLCARHTGMGPERTCREP
jgi:HPt (histidine-containing phosphotransfer) domain-containing protein